jgi:hypothetical protein
LLGLLSLTAIKSTCLAGRQAPPVGAVFKVLNPNRAGHGVSLLTCGHRVLVEPDILCRFAFFKEEQVGADRGLGAEDGVGQAHDGVQVALFEQVLFEAGLHAFAEEGAIG